MPFEFVGRKKIKWEKIPSSLTHAAFHWRRDESLDGFSIHSLNIFVHCNGCRVETTYWQKVVTHFLAYIDEFRCYQMLLSSYWLLTSQLLNLFVYYFCHWDSVACLFLHPSVPLRWRYNFFFRWKMACNTAFAATAHPFHVLQWNNIASWNWSSFTAYMHVQHFV